MVRIASFATAAASLAGLVGAASNGKSDMRVPGGFIFEFTDMDKSDFLDMLDDHGIMRVDFNSSIFNGASVRLHDVDNSDDIAALMATLPSVRSMWPLENFPIQRTVPEWVADGVDSLASSMPASVKRTVEQTTLSTHVMTQVDRLRAEGFTGRGVNIALVDTGVDYTHPDLGGCFGPGCLVARGHDFAGDELRGFEDPMPDDDPMDCDGLGTFTAGIIAGQANALGFTGVAPEITLSAYKVFGCTADSGGPDVVMAGILRAFEDGADIIAAPLGLPVGFTSGPISTAISRIAQAGTPVFSSADNQGSFGLFFSSAPAEGREVMAVASFNNIVTPQLLFSSNYTIDNRSSVEFGYTPTQPSNWSSISLPVWTPPSNASFSTTCDLSMAPEDLSQYISVLPVDGCNYDLLAAQGVARGGQYFLYYRPDPFAPELETADIREVAGTMGSGTILPGVANTIVRAVQSGSTVILDMISPEEADIQLFNVDNTVAGGAAGPYSSWGPTYDMYIKPQFGAPGGNILSTWPMRLGGYGVMTSGLMATPFAAAVGALLGQATGDFSPEGIRARLSATSKPQLFNDGTGFESYLAPVPQQGAGLIQVYDAAKTNVLVVPESISFNDTDNYAESLEVTLTNIGAVDMEYVLSHVPAITMYTLGENSPDVMLFPNGRVENAPATVTFDAETVTVPAGGVATVTISATPPEGLVARRLPLFSGYVALNATDGTSLTVPYIGLGGSLNQATILSEDSVNVRTANTVLGIFAAADPSLVASSFEDAPPRTLFTLPEPGTAGPADLVVPILSIELSMGSPLADVQIVPTRNCGNGTTRGQSVGSPPQFPAQFLTRGPALIPFVGQLSTGMMAPPCEYRIEARALHIYGNPDNPEDWDSARSQPFSIAYAAE